MGNTHRTSGDSSTDETTDRLPEDLQDPEQREIDDVPPDEELTGDAESQDGQASAGGAAGAGGRTSSAGYVNPSSEGGSEGDSLLSTLVNGVLSTDDEELTTEGAGIPPSKLEEWSKSGPDSSPKQTKDKLSRALNRSSQLDRGNIDYRIFLQGSYKNHTNIHGNSDVDVVIQLTAPYRRDSDSLLHDTESVHGDGQKAEYGFQEFKSDIVNALQEEYGHDAVIVDDKAIKIRSADSTLKIDADVVVCQKYRPTDGPESMWFRTESGQVITNHPEEHYKQGAAKNNETGGNYRETIRVFKRVRQNLVHKGRLSKDDAPSYFVAGLLSNVPNEAFVNDRQERYARIVNYLDANRDQLSSFTAQHGQKPLFGRGSTRWNQRDAEKFIDELIWLYKNYYS